MRARCPIPHRQPTYLSSYSMVIRTVRFTPAIASASCNNSSQVTQHGFGTNRWICLCRGKQEKQAGARSSDTSTKEKAGASSRSTGPSREAGTPGRVVPDAAAMLTKAGRTPAGRCCGFSCSAGGRAIFHDREAGQGPAGRAGAGLSLIVPAAQKCFASA